MTQRKVSDIDRIVQGLPGVSKLRAALTAKGILNKHIAVAAGIYAPDVSLWLQDRQDEPAATAWVAGQLGIGEDEVEQLRKDQPSPTAEVA